jgi:hypothetical protein
MFPVSTVTLAVQHPAGIPAVLSRAIAMAERKTRSERRRELQAIQRVWLAQLPAWTGKSLSRIAVEAGLDSGTLTKLANNPNYSGALSQDVIDAVCRTHGVPQPAGGEPDVPAARFFGEAEQVGYETADQHLARVIDALTGGRNAVEPWRLKSRALEAAGLMPGDILAVDLNLTPQDGDVVCAQIYDFERGTAETIFRIFESGVLIAASSDPGLRRVYDERDRSVAIKGVVIGSARPWRAARAAGLAVPAPAKGFAPATRAYAAG